MMGVVRYWSCFLGRILTSKLRPHWKPGHVVDFERRLLVQRKTSQPTRLPERSECLWSFLLLPCKEVFRFPTIPLTSLLFWFSGDFFLFFSERVTLWACHRLKEFVREKMVNKEPQSVMGKVITSSYIEIGLYQREYTWNVCWIKPRVCLPG